MCRQEFLHYLRVREWQDMVTQLRRVLGDIGVAMSSTPDDPDLVHRALLSGLLSHVGMRQQETRDYLGARNARFAIFPGSALFKAKPEWVMAGELVETSRLWGRDVARIDPAWVEPLAEHLVKRTYAEPHWERNRGSAVALETVTLYGVPIVSGRRVAARPRPTPRWPATCSSGTRWSRATGTPGTGSSTPTGSCSPTSRASRSAPGGATSWSTRRPWSTSTTSGSPPTSSPPGTSTAGGRSSGTATPSC